MTDFMPTPQTDDVVRLNGKIKNYRCTRASASFVFTKNNQDQLGIVAIAAAVAGMSGQAASTVFAASGLEELAEYVEFELGSETVKGWVWRSPFAEGDLVDVVAQRRESHHEAYGIARPADRTIALYPHCSRAKGRHIRNAVKWWLIFNCAFFGFITAGLLYLSGPPILREPAFYWINGAVLLWFVLMFVSLTRQYLPFVRVAQKVFLVLGLPDPSDIDLVQSSNAQRTDADPPEFGTFYFRY